MNRLRLLAQILRGLLVQYGWLRSWWEQRPVDARGEPIPWLSYPAIDFLSQFDFSRASVFEWGSGASTLWWSKRCGKIAAVESNPVWIPIITPLLPPSVDLLVTAHDQQAEIQALHDHHTVENDIFVVDNHGAFRRACALAAADHLKEGGFIILDNSDLCPLAAEALRERGFTQIDFTGFAPSNGYAQCTSIFLRGAIGFKTLAGLQPARGPAQPNAPWPGC